MCRLDAWHLLAGLVLEGFLPFRMRVAHRHVPEVAINFHYIAKRNPSQRPRLAKSSISALVEVKEAFTKPRSPLSLKPLRYL